MKKIYLNTGNYVLVDSFIYDTVAKIKWYETTNGYACHYVKKNGKNKYHAMHRLIMMMDDPNLLVDHINGNKLDNRLCNLRPINKSFNAVNRNSKLTKYSGIRKRNNVNYISYSVRLMKDGKEVCGGTYRTLEEAIIARNKLRLHLYGNYYSEYSNWEN